MLMPCLQYAGVRHHAMRLGPGRGDIFSVTLPGLLRVQQLADLPDRFHGKVYDCALVSNQRHLLGEASTRQQSRATRVPGAGLLRGLGLPQRTNLRVMCGRHGNRTIRYNDGWRGQSALVDIRSTEG